MRGGGGRDELQFHPHHAINYPWLHFHLPGSVREEQGALNAPNASVCGVCLLTFLPHTEIEHGVK